MSYYEEKERSSIELVECWLWLIKWSAFIGFFMWLGSKL